MNQELAAAEMLRRIEETFPSMTKRKVDFAMRAISARLQGHNLDELHEEAKSEAEGVALLNAGTQFLESFMQRGGPDTLQEAVDMLRGALAQLPQRHRHRGSALNNLANALMVQYEQDGDTLKLAETVDHHREALLLRPGGHPDRAISLNSLATALMRQYKKDGNMSTLAEMVNRLREALSLHPQGHPYRAGSLNNLASALRMQYQQDGDMSKLAETIDLHREALSLRPQGHPDRAGSLNNLASALRTQYKQDGDISKLAETVDCLREALSLHPQGHPDRAGSLNNLANALRTHYEQDGDTSKLAETVDRHREALLLHPQGHPNHTMSLSNLAIALRTQYEQDGNMSKLAEAVDFHRKALFLRPQGHPDRDHSLVSLANALMTQYEQDGDTSKFAEAVDWHREALSLHPPGHPNHGASLHNLSNSYYIQHQRDGSESALINALNLRRECLDSRILGHPERYSAHYSVADVQLPDSSLFDWAEALDHLIQAMKDDGASPRLRLIRGIESLRRVETASARDIKQYLYSQQALNVYVQAIQLLPRAAHAGLGVSARLRELTGSEQLCRAAAMRAMLLNQLPTAVEVFEEGKAVFWSQALRLRSTALDKLPTADSERLTKLFRELNTDHSGRFVEGLGKGDLEKHIEHRRRLNSQAERLVEDIRRRPGFDRFLRIPQFEQLAQAASNGYIVALVASEPTSFAIIIQAGRAPQHILLSSVDGKKLRRLTELTSGSGMRDLADERAARQRLHARMPLEQIWVTIVKPVLLHLGLQVRHNPLI
jgi:tetratricopeptide (TPR) repeat protein